MKKILAVLCLLSVQSLFAENADLTLTTGISSGYVTYLNNELTACNGVLAGSPSDTLAMKTHAMRIFIDISLIQCKADSALKCGKTIVDSINTTNQNVVNFYNSSIATLNAANGKSFFNSLLALFKDPKYGQLKSDLQNISGDYKSELSDFSTRSQDLTDYVSNALRQISADFNILKNNAVPFHLQLQVSGRGFNENLSFDQTHFWETGAIINLCNESLASFGQAGKKFASMQNGNAQPADMIDSLKAAIHDVSLGLDSLSHLLSSDPLTVFSIDTSWISDAQQSLSNLTDILNGEVFTTGSDSLKIRPVALIEHSADDWVSIVLDFYRTANRYGYTFGNLFPSALPALYVDRLKEDMIINASDGEDAMNARMFALKTKYLDSLAVNPNNSSANLGAAAAQTYLYMVDLNKEIKNFVNYVKTGDFRNGFQFLVLNNTAVTDSISRYYNAACSDRQLVFIALVITNAQAQPYIMNSATEYVPLFVPQTAIANLRDFSKDLTYSVRNLGDHFHNLAQSIDTMFNMSLDPNYLDFSNVKTPLDLILALKASNPNFLNITPYGITKMQDMRVQLRKGLSSYAAGLDTVNQFLDSLAIYRSEFNLNEWNVKKTFSNLNTFVQQVNTDFQQPDSTTMIDGVKVNLSAWFDNPPQNLLLKLQWYFDNDPTTDNTLGGLFPGKGIGDGIQDHAQIPAVYSLSQNYPNPFNPSTSISFSLPSASAVTLKVYDILGRETAVLVSGELQAGNYTRQWNAANMSSGIYFYRLTANAVGSKQAGRFSETKKLIVLK